MIFALITGIAFGVLGLIPFLHTNLLLQLLQNTLAQNTFSQPIEDAVFATALAFTHIAFEPLPALLLCIPTATQNVSVLPGHAMVLKGQGTKAFRTILSSLFFSALLTLVVSPIAFVALPIAFDAVKPFIAFALLGVLAVMFWSEKSLNKVARTMVPFSLAGIFGLIALNSSIARETLFPMLTGLFGIPALMLALPPKATAEEKTIARVNEKISIKPKLIALGCILGLASVLLPALSPALVAGVVFAAMELKHESFLSLTSSIAGSRAVFELVGLAAIGKARSGYSVAVRKAVENVTPNELALLTVAGVVALCIGIAIVLLLYKGLVNAAKHLNSRKANVALLVFIATALFLTSGPQGVLIAGVATSIGVLPPLLNTNRSCLMAALILPVIGYYLA